MRVIDGAEDWTADAAMVDADRWDCRLADPTFAILDTGEVLVGYRGNTQCGRSGRVDGESMGVDGVDSKAAAPRWRGPAQARGAAATRSSARGP